MSAFVPQQTTKSGMGCWKMGLFGCLGIAILFILGSIIMGYYIVKGMPNAKETATCIQNLQQIHAAVERYKVRNGAYPDDLNQLSPTFLSNAGMLHCPLDSSGQAVSYTYNKPADDAPGTTVVVSCSRHMIMKKPVILGIQKDGKMSTPMPVTPAR